MIYMNDFWQSLRIGLNPIGYIINLTRNGPTSNKFQPIRRGYHRQNQSPILNLREQLLESYKRF